MTAREVCRCGHSRHLHYSDHYDRITRERRCWCDIIDAAVPVGDRRTDYRGTWTCECDAPLPWDAGKPIAGRCHCPPSRGQR